MTNSEDTAQLRHPSQGSKPKPVWKGRFKRETSRTNKHAPTRVAHILQDLSVGGAERLAVEFARHTNRDKFSLSFVALGEDGSIGERIRAEGWPVKRMGPSQGLSASLFLRLGRLLRRQNINVIHTHLDRPHVYGTVAGRIAGIGRIVHTRHGQCDDLTKRQRRLASVLARWTSNFVCVSEDAAMIARSQGVPNSRVCTIWNGVDLKQFSPIEINRDGYVVTVARLSPEKDIANFLRAAAIVAKLDKDLQFKIAGDGPCREELQQLAGRLGLAQQVVFLGKVDDVASLLAGASVFVLPSITEGIPLTILEAQARGLPIIATRVGGTPEVVVDGETGMLVPARSATALAAAIKKLRECPELGVRLGQAGRSRIESHFDVERMVRRYETLYHPCTYRC